MTDSEFLELVEKIKEMHRKMDKLLLSNKKLNCRNCKHVINNELSFVEEEYRYENPLTKSNYKPVLRVKPRSMYCKLITQKNGKPCKINGNHLRWYGFDKRCPLNPYKHTCIRCGTQMFSENDMCNSCKKKKRNF